MKNRMKTTDALLIVDAQNDFFPGGSLAVPHGDEIIPIVNEWIKASQAQNIPIFASRDWHPINHCSFHQQGGPWPEHCVQNTSGAKIHPDIHLPSSVIIIDKASDPDVETFSAFDGQTKTGLSLVEVLQQQEIKRLWICGLTLDYCVLKTSLSAIEHGFEARVLLSATRAITKKTGDDAIRELEEAGAIIETSPLPYE